MDPMRKNHIGMWEIKKKNLVKCCSIVSSTDLRQMIKELVNMTITGKYKLVKMK